MSAHCVTTAAFFPSRAAAVVAFSDGSVREVSCDDTTLRSLSAGSYPCGPAATSGAVPPSPPTFVGPCVMLPSPASHVFVVPGADTRLSAEATPNAVDRVVCVTESKAVVVLQWGAAPHDVSVPSPQRRGSHGGGAAHNVSLHDRRVQHVQYPAERSLRKTAARICVAELAAGVLFVVPQLFSAGKWAPAEEGLAAAAKAGALRPPANCATVPGRNIYYIRPFAPNAEKKTPSIDAKAPVIALRRHPLRAPLLVALTADGAVRVFALTPGSLHPPKLYSVTPIEIPSAALSATSAGVTGWFKSSTALLWPELFATVGQPGAWGDGRVGAMDVLATPYQRTPADLAPGEKPTAVDHKGRRYDPLFVAVALPRSVVVVRVGPAGPPVSAFTLAAAPSSIFAGLCAASGASFGAGEHGLLSGATAHPPDAVLWVATIRDTAVGTAAAPQGASSALVQRLQLPATLTAYTINDGLCAPSKLLLPLEHVPPVVLPMAAAAPAHVASLNSPLSVWAPAASGSQVAAAVEHLPRVARLRLALHPTRPLFSLCVPSISTAVSHGGAWGVGRLGSGPLPSSNPVAAPLTAPAGLRAAPVVLPFRCVEPAALERSAAGTALVTMPRYVVASEISDGVAGSFQWGPRDRPAGTLSTLTVAAVPAALPSLAAPTPLLRVGFDSMSAVVHTEEVPLGPAASLVAAEVAAAGTGGQCETFVVAALVSWAALGQPSGDRTSPLVALAASLGFAQGPQAASPVHLRAAHPGVLWCRLFRSTTVVPVCGARCDGTLPLLILQSTSTWRVTVLRGEALRLDASVEALEAELLGSDSPVSPGNAKAAEYARHISSFALSVQRSSTSRLPDTVPTAVKAIASAASAAVASAAGATPTGIRLMAVPDATAPSTAPPMLIAVDAESQGTVAVSTREWWTSAGSVVPPAAVIHVAGSPLDAPRVLQIAALHRTADELLLAVEIAPEALQGAGSPELAVFAISAERADMRRVRHKQLWRRPLKSPLRALFWCGPVLLAQTLPGAVLWATALDPRFDVVAVVPEGGQLVAALPDRLLVVVPPPTDTTVEPRAVSITRGHATATHIPAPLAVAPFVWGFVHLHRALADVCLAAESLPVAMVASTAATAASAATSIATTGAAEAAAGAESAARLVAKHAKPPPPPDVFDSLFGAPVVQQAAQVAAQVPSHVPSQVTSQVTSHVSAQVSAQVNARVPTEITQAASQVSAQVSAGIAAQAPRIAAAATGAAQQAFPSDSGAERYTDELARALVWWAAAVLLPSCVPPTFDGEGDPQPCPARVLGWRLDEATAATLVRHGAVSANWHDELRHLLPRRLALSPGASFGAATASCVVSQTGTLSFPQPTHRGAASPLEEHAAAAALLALPANELTEDMRCRIDGLARGPAGAEWVTSVVRCAAAADVSRGAHSFPVHQGDRPQVASHVALVAENLQALGLSLPPLAQTRFCRRPRPPQDARASFTNDASTAAVAHRVRVPSTPFTLTAASCCVPTVTFQGPPNPRWYSDLAMAQLSPGAAAAPVHAALSATPSLSVSSLAAQATTAARAPGVAPAASALLSAATEAARLPGTATAVQGAVQGAVQAAVVQAVSDHESPDLAGAAERQRQAREAFLRGTVAVASDSSDSDAENAPRMRHLGGGALRLDIKLSSAPLSPDGPRLPTPLPQAALGLMPPAPAVGVAPRRITSVAPSPPADDSAAAAPSDAAQKEQVAGLQRAALEAVPSRTLEDEQAELLRTFEAQQFDECVASSQRLCKTVLRMDPTARDLTTSQPALAQAAQYAVASRLLLHAAALLPPDEGATPLTPPTTPFTLRDAPPPETETGAAVAFAQVLQLDLVTAEHSAALTMAILERAIQHRWVRSAAKAASLLPVTPAGAKLASTRHGQQVVDAAQDLPLASADPDSDSTLLRALSGWCFCPILFKIMDPDQRVSCSECGIRVARDGLTHGLTQCPFCSFGTFQC